VIPRSAYTQSRSLHIALGHPIHRQLEEHGLTPELMTFDDDAVRRVISSYTREAGVRSLERQIGAIARKIAARVATDGAVAATIVVRAEDIQGYLGPPRVHDEVSFRTSRPGVATGLAWTETGGDVLFVEASLLPGGHHNLILT